MKNLWMNLLGSMGVVALALSIVLAPGTENVSMAQGIGPAPGSTINNCGQPGGTPGPPGLPPPGPLGTCSCPAANAHCIYYPLGGGAAYTYVCIRAVAVIPNSGGQPTCVCTC